jgi:hypothetical protein
MAWYKVRRRFLDTDTKVIYELGVFLEAEPSWADRFGNCLEKSKKPVPQERADGSVVNPRIQRVILPPKSAPKLATREPKVAPDVGGAVTEVEVETPKTAPARRKRSTS